MSVSNPITKIKPCAEEEKILSDSNELSELSDRVEDL